MPSVLSVFDIWTITVQPFLYYVFILPNQGSFYLQEVEYGQQMTYSLPIGHVYFTSNCSQRINVCTVTLDWSKALCRPSSFLPPGTQASQGGKPQIHIFLYWRRTTAAPKLNPGTSEVQGQTHSTEFSQWEYFGLYFCRTDKLVVGCIKRMYCEYKAKFTRAHWAPCLHKGLAACGRWALVGHHREDHASGPTPQALLGKDRSDSSWTEGHPFSAESWTVQSLRGPHLTQGLAYPHCMRAMGFEKFYQNEVLFHN